MNWEIWREGPDPDAFHVRVNGHVSRWTRTEVEREAARRRPILWPVLASADRERAMQEALVALGLQASVA